MSYRTTKLGVPPQGIESMVIGDLSFTPDPGLESVLNLVPPELLRASAAVTVELMDYGGADEASVAEVLREIRPELAAEYGDPLSGK
jgi:hypothetical protein